MLELEGKLEAAEDVAAQRERELQGLVDGLRRDKRELEARAAGVDLQAMQQGDELVRQVRLTPLCTCRWRLVGTPQPCLSAVGQRASATCVATPRSLGSGVAAGEAGDGEHARAVRVPGRLNAW